MVTKMTSGWPTGGKKGSVVPLVCVYVQATAKRLENYVLCWRGNVEVGELPMILQARCG